MNRRLRALTLASLMLPSAMFFAAEGRAGSDLDWLSASSAFKLELHALAAEALMLQLETPPLSSQHPSRADQKIRIDARDRLSDSLSTANALLSMMEIAEHSDRGPRVREVLLLWLSSARSRLADHREALEEASGRRGGPAADTAAFMEEVKILWRRLDRGYSDLQDVITPSPAGQV